MISRPLRVIWLLAGIVLGQALLYGPSLVGLKVLLPLDILTGPGVYLPLDPGKKPPEIQNVYLTDLIYVAEPVRLFLHHGLKVGHWPLWMPTQYAGTPAAYTFFSPLLLLQALTASPTVLAWTALLGALTAGAGAYLVFRRVLSVGFWPATICAWCYPLSGFFIFWQGYPTGYPVWLLPWLLLAVHETATRKSRGWMVGLALLTALVLSIGNLDVAGQVLLSSGLFGLWCLYRSRQADGPSGTGLLRRTGLLGLAWLIGFLLAAPHFLPLVEYGRSGSRIERREHGEEERPPVGLQALPQVLVPDLYGAYGKMKTGSYRLVSGNQQESSAAAYAGILAAGFLAPLAWYRRQSRPVVVFWIGAAILGLAWSLNLPLFVQLLRLPGLNLMSHNRFVFLTAFSLLALAALGADVLLNESQLAWRKWMGVCAGALAVLGAWCFFRSFSPPEPLGFQAAALLGQGQPVGWMRTQEDLARTQDWFISMYTTGGLMCLGSAAAWLLVRMKPAIGRQWLVPLAVLLPLDLLWFAHGRAVQSDWELYYPQLPVLRQLAVNEPGRVIGYQCLPPQLASTCGLRDVRGYDAVDPNRYVELLSLAAAPKSPALSYALTQWLVPQAELSSKGVTLPPILNLLNVRSVIYRGAPPNGVSPAFYGEDYWVMTNANVLPRAFVPRNVRVITDKQQRLRTLGSPDFSPLDTAYVEEAVSLAGPATGSARITDETPNRLKLEVQMETPGLVVLADRWDRGWTAFLDGKRVPILIADHALRGVLAPAGKSILEFRYQPASLVLGGKLASLGGILLLGLTVFAIRRHPGA